MRWFRRRPAVPALVRRNISTIADLEAEVARRRSSLDRLSDRVTAFVGSMTFVVAHLVFFAIWMGVNTAWLLGSAAFDPYPYVFLNLVLAIESVLLGTFILMSQNRQNRQDEQRAHLELQISLLAEQESTKTLQLLRRICGHLKIEDACNDQELNQLIETTHIQNLAKELEQTNEANGSAQ